MVGSWPSLAKVWSSCVQVVTSRFQVLRWNHRQAHAMQLRHLAPARHAQTSPQRSHRTTDPPSPSSRCLSRVEVTPSRQKLFCQDHHRVARHRTNSPSEVLECIQTTMRWKWPQVQSRALTMLTKQAQRSLHQSGCSWDIQNAYK